MIVGPTGTGKDLVARARHTVRHLQLFGGGRDIV
jgi:transcriptional regulator with AAA-type ATPase domain